jgi:hypothetical protein
MQAASRPQDIDTGCLALCWARGGSKRVGDDEPREEGVHAWEQRVRCSHCRMLVIRVQINIYCSCGTNMFLQHTNCNTVVSEYHLALNEPSTF